MAAEVVGDGPRAGGQPEQLPGLPGPDDRHLVRPRESDHGSPPRTRTRLGAADLGGRFRLSVVMAAFNEERTVAQAIREVLAIDFPCDTELIVVDDGSSDRTPEILAEISDPRLTVYRHEENRGKGAALLSAAEIATGSYLIPFDADLEYAAEDVLRMLEPVLKGRCSVVYGARLFGYNTVYRSYRYAIGNKALTRITNILYDACLSDLHTCLKLIPAPLLRSLDLHENGFGLDTEITACLLRGGIRPFEVPVSYFGRSHEEGKKITWRDAVACVGILIRVRLSRRPVIDSDHVPVTRKHRPRLTGEIISAGPPALEEPDGEVVGVAG